MNDQRRRNPALVDPCLVPAKRRVRGRRPPRAETQVRGGRAGCGSRVVAVVTHHDLGAGPVVGEEQNQRVVEGIHRAELLKHATDLAIHPVDHRGVDRHLRGLKLSLLVGQPAPGQRPVDFRRSECLQRLGKVVRRPHFRFHRRQPARHNPQALNSPPSLPADRLPPLAVFFPIPGDVCRRRVQREVGGRERQIMEERPVGVFLRVLLEATDGVVGNRSCCVVTGSRLDRRQLPIIFVVDFRVEEPPLVSQVVGAVEPARERHPVDVPLARVIRPIAQGIEHLRQQPRPLGPLSAAAAADTRNRIPTHLLRVIPGQQSGARGPAASRVVELRKPQPTGGQPVEIRRFNLPTVTAQIGETEIVGKDNQHIGALCRRSQRRDCQPHGKR